jgi:hypothetical protein
MGRAAEPSPREAAVYVAERLLTAVRDEVTRADTKAAVLLSGALAGPALLLGRHVPPHGGGLPVALLLGAGAALWAAGTALLVWTIVPRTGTLRGGPGVTYFGDARPGQDLDTLLRAVDAAGRDRAGWLMTQFVDVSGILTAKYRCLRWGMSLLAAALTAGGAVLALTA